MLLLLKLVVCFHFISTVYGGCGPLRVPYFGQLQGDCAGNDGDICTLTCSENYHVHGSINKTCNSTLGKWEPSGPFSCLDKSSQCKPLRTPRNGNFRRQCSNFAGSSCYIGCNPGYFLEGSKRLVCMPKTLKWAPKVPTCKPLLCPPLSAPRNGFIVSKDCKRHVGAHCEFACDQGYYLYGSRFRSCTSGGVWFGKLAKCVKICPDLVPRANMKLWNYCSPGVSGQACSVTCDEGYVVDGNNKIVSHMICGYNGLWESPLPHCTQSTCPPLNPPGNGTYYGDCKRGVYGMPCIFSCNYGFKLTGDESVFCRKNGEWSSKPPSCKEIFCNGIPWENVLKFEGTCEPGYPDKWCNVECVPGFEVPKNRNVTCQVSGKWFPEKPLCNKRIKCDPLIAPENGFIEESCSFEIHSTCQQMCFPDFVAQGPGYRRCLPTGFWDGVPRQCIHKNKFMPEKNYIT